MSKFNKNDKVKIIKGANVGMEATIFKVENSDDFHTNEDVYRIKCEAYPDGIIMTESSLVLLSESMNDSYSVFTEAKKDKKGGDEGSAKSYVTDIMLHLFKLKFSTDKDSHKHWRDEIEEFRIKYKEAIYNKNIGKNNTNIVNAINREFDTKLFKNSKDQYIKLANKPDGKHLIPGLKHLPKECPWTLEEVIFGNINKILELI